MSARRILVPAAVLTTALVLAGGLAMPDLAGRLALAEWGSRPS